MRVTTIHLLPVLQIFAQPVSAQRYLGADGRLRIALGVLAREKKR